MVDAFRIGGAGADVGSAGYLSSERREPVEGGLFYVGFG